MNLKKIGFILFLTAILSVTFVLCMIDSFISARNLPDMTKKRWQESKQEGRTAGMVEKGLILLVEFPDVKHDVDRNFVQGRFSQRLNSYVREMSYDKVSIGVDLTKQWIKMPQPISAYKISSRNLEVDKSRVRK